MRVLLSAYACEPNSGSEPGTGWNLAFALSEYFQVTVLTRANNRRAIESFLGSSIETNPEFIYYDLPVLWKFLKRYKLLSTRLYYVLWQRTVCNHLLKNEDLSRFDLLHHITFNSFEIAPTLFERFKGKKVWGPIGGGQKAPVSLLATLDWQNDLKERFRSLRLDFTSRSKILLRRVASCDLVIFANQETACRLKERELRSAGHMIDVGVDPEKFFPSGLKRGHRIFFAGNFEARKGTRFLLLAFKEAFKRNPQLRLRMAGDGPCWKRELLWIRKSGMTEVVELLGRRSHQEMAEEFQESDIFVFPSIRDTSGAIVLEAMSCGLPTVALAHQGANSMIDESSGIKVAVRGLPETISEFARAILELSINPKLRAAMGAGARDRAIKEFSWRSKARWLAGEYRKLN